ncbi:putative calpain-9 isoform X1 [Apostichopus japonicus]|uniref:Putative calpain-9 isoform X1 n=1 Tax=Stichopus japonicus TaxID=307972 RepID=A0A2G8KKC3_STIJA|nr:putative calpain-9 isoform X1 [Apostichopus japonicus]
MPRSKPTYDQLRKQLLQKNALFEDPDFPAVNQSLFFSTPPKPFEWKRPSELCDNPQMFVGGASRFDIAQGELGDCWFLAALAALALDEHLLFKVVPPDQSFSQGYAGIFKFMFWQYGEWKEIVVDDRLPTYQGRLVFVHSTDKNEFWSALLEKAYAKLHGSYESLKGGNTIEAMEDFTGGISESFNLRDKTPKNLFRVLLKAYERDAQIGSSIDQAGRGMEAVTNSGLVVGHAYTMTDVKKVNVSTQSGKQKVRLIRLRNPWGQKEWNGRWSDKSNEWKYINQKERDELGLVLSDDGEFWMQYEDFIQEFTRVDVCNLSPASMRGTRGNKKWIENIQQGRWQKGASAGGCRNFPDTFWINPQFALGLEEEDDPEDDDEEEDDPSIPKTGGTFMVALMQKNRRKQRKMGIDNLTIGFAIYEFKDQVGQLEKNYFLYNASKARSHTFVNTREISGRYKLPVGRYCVVPSTFEPNQEGDFLLRIYSLKQSSAGQLDEQTGTVDLPREPEPTPQQSAAIDSQNKRFEEFFKKLTGDDMEVDAWELQEVLNAAMKKELHGGSFSVESCKSMVALSDTDRNGKLGFEEFVDLWRDLVRWRNVFKKFDKDNSGSFSTHELRAAMRSVGYKMNSQVFGAIVLRYGDRNNQISYDSFIACAIKLKNMFDTFMENKQGNNASLSLNDFLMVNMYS